MVEWFFWYYLENSNLGKTEQRVADTCPWNPVDVWTWKTRQKLFAIDIVLLGDSVLMYFFFLPGSPIKRICYAKTGNMLKQIDSQNAFLNREDWNIVQIFTINYVLNWHRTFCQRFIWPKTILIYLDVL